MWLALLRVRQRRLVSLRKAELALPGVREAVRPVRVEGVAGLLYVRGEDFPQVEAAILAEGDNSFERGRAVLLAPLDPLLYDRKLTGRLWNYDYTWEVYTPAAKRRRGYYALPVLRGLALAGHVDPWADRAKGVLRARNWDVPGSPDVPEVREAFGGLAEFLGLREEASIQFSTSNIQ